MASAPNPIASILRSQMVARLAQGGGAGAAGAAGAGAGSPESAGDQLSTQIAELRGADPQMMQRTLTQIKGMLVSLYSRAAFQVPKAARAIAQAQRYVDDAIRESEQAAATASTVRGPQSMIANNAALANPSAPSQGGAPAEGGM